MIILSAWRELLSSQVSLSLNAYSFNEKELDIIPNVLFRAGIKEKQIERIHRDEAGRIGEHIGLRSEEIDGLEKRLDLRFLADRKGDVVIVPDWALRDEASPFAGIPDRFGLWLPFRKERPYCCRELALHGDGKESVQITADDDDDALFKCALFGGQRNWFGSKANKGPCLTLKRHQKRST